MIQLHVQNCESVKIDSYERELRFVADHDKDCDCIIEISICEKCNADDEKPSEEVIGALSILNLTIQYHKNSTIVLYVDEHILKQIQN
jgi:hypothetical protein